MKIRGTILKICCLGVCFIITGLAFRQADIAARASIEVPTSENGRTHSSSAGRPSVFIEINRSGKIWMNSKSIHNVTAIDDFLRTRCGFDGSSLRATFRCDHRADAEPMLAVISELQKFTPKLGICLIVKSENSDREAYLGANLKLREGGDETGDEQPLTPPASNDDDTLRLALEADGSFTMGVETYCEVGMLDQWKIRETIAEMLEEEFRVIATIDRRCTIDHLTTLLNIASYNHSNAQITIILAEPSNGKK